MLLAGNLACILQLADVKVLSNGIDLNTKSNVKCLSFTLHKVAAITCDVENLSLSIIFTSALHFIFEVMKLLCMTSETVLMNQRISENIVVLEMDCYSHKGNCHTKCQQSVHIHPGQGSTNNQLKISLKSLIHLRIVFSSLLAYCFIK